MIELAAASWPALRDELALYPGPTSADGAPTWSLHDPVRNLYFRLDWLSFEILSRWEMRNASEIARDLAARTPLSASPATVAAVAQFLEANELVKRDRQSQTLAAHHARRQHGWMTWLLHHYLFFRVPLWRPDAFLSRTAGWVAPFYSRTFLLLTLCALVAGLMQIGRQWDHFSATLIDSVSLSGVVSFGVTLALVKFLHELGHAYTAKRHGCRVPSMGVAFLVMFPVAYTDVSDVWKLPARRARLAVGAAGIATELVLAAWASLAWAVLPEGALRDAAFLVATTTWVSTLAINASPFMRFDGYFLLMDFLEFPNLHSRAFALARWRLREVLFGLGEPPPEVVGAARARGLMLFAWGTWLYRLVLFCGIAALVYFAVPKPAGPLLAAVEIGWFIVWPVAAELKIWCANARAIVRAGRSALTALLLAALVALWVLPWDGRVRAAALLSPAHTQPLVSPGPAVLGQIVVPNGASVREGEVIAQLHAPDLAHQQSAARARSQGLDWQADAAGVETRLREQRAVIAAARQKVGAELEGLQTERARYTLRAAFDGVVVWSQPDWASGAWLAKNESLGQVVAPGVWQVHAYLPESETSRIAVGDTARFFPEADPLSPLDLTVARIDPDATRVLPDGILASTRGGSVLVREQRGQLIPEGAIYRVSFTLNAPPPRHTALRGEVVIQGARRAWFEAYWRAAAAWFWQEAGF